MNSISNRLRNMVILGAVALLGEAGVGVLFYTWVSRPRPAHAVPVKAPQPTAVYDKFGPIVVNPAGTNGTRMLTAQISLLLDSEETSKQIDKQKSLIIDVLVNALRQLHPEDVNRPEAIEAMKKEMVRGMNRVLGKGKVMGVSIEDLLVQ